MGLFDAIEKLINEHGSAAILREHLGLLRAQQTALEAKNKNLEVQTEQLQSDNRKLQEELGMLRAQLQGAQTGNPDGHVCDHCGSGALRRTGNRPDPTFGEVGIKQALFTCTLCSKVSAFTLMP